MCYSRACALGTRKKREGREKPMSYSYFKFLQVVNVSTAQHYSCGPLRQLLQDKYIQNLVEVILEIIGECKEEKLVGSIVAEGVLPDSPGDGEAREGVILMKTHEKTI
jgi:hypothetical protein